MITEIINDNNNDNSNGDDHGNGEDGINENINDDTNVNVIRIKISLIHRIHRFCYLWAS